MKKIYGLNIAGIVLASMGGLYVTLAVVLHFAAPDAGDTVFYPFIIMGGLMAVVGAALLSVYAVYRKNRASLRETGEKIFAKVLRVDKLYLYNRNGKTPSVLVCLYTENGVDYVYKSDLIWDEPLLKSDVVGIYIDREHPKRYVVAVDEILIPTVER